MKPAKTDANSRSDAVRQRRAKRTQDTTRRAYNVASGKQPPARRVRYSAEAPTIFVRGGIDQQAYSRGGFISPVVKRAQTNRPRRKVAIPLGNSGAEMIMPAMPAIHLGWRLISGLMVAGLVTLLFMAWNSPLITVGTPIVSGLERLSASDIAAVIDMEGQPIFMLDQDKVTADLQAAFPDLKNIAVAVKLPNQVIVSAVERKPVMAWTYHGDRTIWIDEEGAIFPARGELTDPILEVQSEVTPPTAIDLPTEADLELASTPAAGKNSAKVEVDSSQDSLYKKKIDPSIQKVLTELAKQMPAKTTLVYNPTEGFGWTDNGLKVYVGQSLNDLSVKLNVYKAIAEKLSKDGLKPSMISVAFAHAPYYRLEQ
jgi:cell division septal protein FtsQ